jgi:hypothetical protein
LLKKLNERPVLVQGKEDMNRATAGDLVVVEVFDEGSWKVEKEVVLEGESEMLSIRIEDDLITGAFFMNRRIRRNGN